MSADDFKTGTRVCLDNSSAQFGYVVDDDAKRAEYKGFVPVRWDNGDRTMARAASLIPIDSRSATPQADRGQTAGTPTSPQGAPAPTQLDRIEVLLTDIRDLLPAWTKKPASTGPVLNITGLPSSPGGLAAEAAFQHRRNRSRGVPQ